MSEETKIGLCGLLLTLFAVFAMPWVMELWIKNNDFAKETLNPTPLLPPNDKEL